MNDLIAKYFSGEITAKEKEELFSRMAKEDDLKLEFASFQNIRALTTLLPSDRDIIEGFDKLMEFKKSKRYWNGNGNENLFQKIIKNLTNFYEFIK